MKKPFFIIALFIMVAAIVWQACEKDDEDKKAPAGQNNEIIFNEPAVDSVSYRMAKISFKLDNTGKTNIESIGICWGLKENPTIDSNKTTLEEGYSGQVEITGLLPGTGYFFRVFVKTKNWAAYGENKTLTTNALGTPIIGTQQVSGVTAISAVSGGIVTEINGSEVSQCGVCWNKTGNPSVNDGITKDTLSSGNFISHLEDLDIGQKYYLKAYAINEAGTSYGQEISFTTKDGTISLTTNDATGVTYNSATCGGNITDSGGLAVTERGLCWSKSQQPTIDDSYFNEGAGTGSYSHNIDSLDHGTTYYVRAYAKNSKPGKTTKERGHERQDTRTGRTSRSSQVKARSVVNRDSRFSRKGQNTTKAIFYGGQKSFTTNGLATVTTAAISNITPNTAVSGGEVTSNGGEAVTARGVCWSASPNPTLDDNFTTDGSGTGAFTSNISGLDPGMNYYARAYATNAAGTAYGSQEEFLTIPVLPTVTTTEITNITANSAQSGGDITNNGGGNIIARGVCWDISTNPTIDDDHTTDGTGSGSFISNITGLEPGTSYYVRAYATNTEGKTLYSKLSKLNKEAGTGYGNELNFSTLIELPNVTTSAVINITANSATSGGNVTNNGGGIVSARGVCWSTSPNPTLDDNYTTDGSGIGSFVSDLSGLQPGTGYYLCAYATNETGTAYGDEINFTTIGLAEVTTASITNIAGTTATGGGDVINNGGGNVASRGVCWSTSPNPTIDDDHTNDGGGVGTFTSNITGLLNGTTYYVKAYATNEAGTAYGQEVSFTTIDYAGITTDAVTNITSTTATGGGNVTSEGGGNVSARGVCWSTSPNPTISDDHTTDGSGTGTFTSSITGLSPGTTYYVRAYATNEAGTAYGSEENFSSLIILPVVTTTSVTNITNTTATSGGMVSENGGGTVSARGVCWSSSPDPTVNDDHTIDGSGTGSFTSNLTGLQPLTTYYLRAYATNEAGTAYGDEITFSTIDLPTVTTDPITNIAATTATGGGEVTSNGNGTVSARGVCWSTSPNPTLDDDYTVDGSGVGSFVSDITGLSPATDYYVRAYVTNEAGTTFGNEISFYTIPIVTNPTTGKTWMDRNLGASRAAISSTDTLAYGDLYQWGRDTDGHQVVTSSITSTLSNSDSPGHSYFITTSDNPHDWRSPQNDNLWQGVNGINNPCPSGYRLPTEAEWEAERQSWGSNDAAGAYASPLKLPVAGRRLYYSGSLYEVGSRGEYWSSTVYSTNSLFLYFYSNNADIGNSHRAGGFSVRCIKDE